MSSLKIEELSVINPSITMPVFRNIPHVERHIYKRTTMNEIVLFFTYDVISIKEKRDQILSILKQNKLIALSSPENTAQDTIVYLDGDIVISFVSSGVLVNIPASKYRDFHETKGMWIRLGKLLQELNLNTLVWTFTKGNRLVFTNQLDEKDKQEMLKMVFSDNLIKAVGNDRIYVEESIDKKRIVTCRYGFEAYKDKTALSLKTMITTLSYKPENLLQEVFETNDLMFDVWYWTAGEDLKTVMDKEL